MGARRRRRRRSPECSAAGLPSSRRCLRATASSSCCAAHTLVRGARPVVGARDAQTAKPPHTNGATPCTAQSPPSSPARQRSSRSAQRVGSGSGSCARRCWLSAYVVEASACAGRVAAAQSVVRTRRATTVVKSRLGASGAVDSGEGPIHVSRLRLRSGLCRRVLLAAVHPLAGSDRGPMAALSPRGQPASRSPAEQGAH